MNRSKVVRMSEAGFTLVELMIVVAIIGILAAIAIPNFQKYQAKARQKEAQLALSAIYTAETANMGEHGSFTGCLRQAGYVPEGGAGAANQGDRYYATGFEIGTANNAGCRDKQNNAIACTDALTVGMTSAPGTANCGAAAAQANLNFGAVLVNGHYAQYSANKRIGANGGTGATIPSVNMTNITFTAGAVGSVASTAAANDAWTMTNNKILLNSVIGI